MLTLSRCADATYARENAALDEFCTRLRKLPCCQGSWFVFIIEANLDWMRAKFLAQRAPTFYPALAFDEDPNNKGRPGVWTTNPRKEQMNNDANFFMTLNALHIMPLSSVVSVGNAKETKATMETFREQLKSYRRQIDRPNGNDQSKECKARYTGKAPGSKDDMVIAFQLALTYGMAFWADPMRTRVAGVGPQILVNRIRPELNQIYDAA